MLRLQKSHHFLNCLQHHLKVKQIRHAKKRPNKAFDRLIVALAKRITIFVRRRQIIFYVIERNLFVIVECIECQIKVANF